MSVINQMLKDLDQRKAAATVGLDPSLPFANQEESNNNRWLMFLLGIIAILLIFVIYTLNFPLTKTVQQEVISHQPTKELVEEPAVPIIEPANIEPANIEPANIEPANIEPANIEPANIEPENFQEPNQLLKQQINHNNQTTAAGSDPVAIPEAETEEKQYQIVKSNRQIDKKAQAERLFQSAREKVQARQHLEATGLLEQALQSSDELHKARILLFTLLLQQQQITSLQPRLEYSIKQWPTVHEYRQVKARLLSFESDNEAALQLLESDIPVVSKAPEYHELLAYVAQQLKKDQVAIKHYQMLLQQNSNRADWWLGIAVSEDRLGNKQPALQAFQQALNKQGLSSTVQAYARKRIKALQGF
ncbi:MAG: hypothetical protein GY829_13070 [Gammaproteobacteria bacterium]|nr:hypothetical protein [Gammaproteobacteria bacterium]